MKLGPCVLHRRMTNRIVEFRTLDMSLKNKENIIKKFLHRFSQGLSPLAEFVHPEMSIKSC